MISSRHQHPNRGFHPAPDEYNPAKRAAEAAGYPISHLLRAMLRWFNRNPGRALELLKPDLKDIANETTVGRPRSRKSK